ncbi:MAG: hypothetical protein MUE81_20570 [Thermoflexibacter sp.]|jgi:hypothetical protein|nr:hypothetical protein [Thermoflexibacter sp.]
MKKITNTTIQVFFVLMMLACSNLYAQHSNRSISYSSDNGRKSGNISMVNDRVTLRIEYSGKIKLSAIFCIFV